MHKVKQERIYLIFIILIVFCIFQYGVQKICGFTLYPDEFGYWASAAAVAGYDWSEVASLGSYYSFGYSVLLTPILKLFTNGVSAYRAAIAVNMIFMCVSVFLLWNIVGRVFPEVSKIKQVFTVGIAVLYPAWIFYMQMTLAEALLMFLFVTIVWLFICFIQKPAVWKIVILSAALVYTYSVHMRTVGVLIACLITLLLWGLMNPAVRKQLVFGIGILVLAGSIAVLIKRNVIFTVFSEADSEMLAANDYASQIWKIRHILTLQGLWLFIKEILAKFFYLGLASFGIIYWAIGWCLKETVKLVKNIVRGKSRVGTNQQWLALFLLLSVMSEVLICSIYMHGTRQIDGLIYGRYIEFLMPVFLVIGIGEMFEGQWGLKTVFTVEAISGILLLPVLNVIATEEMEGIRGFFVVGISYLLREDNFSPYLFLVKAWLFGAVLILLVTGITRSVKKWKNMAWLLGIMMVLEVMLGIQASTHYTYRVNRVSFQDLIISEKIEENRKADERVVYLDEGETAYIDFQQMQMPDVSVQVIKAEEITDDMDVPGEFLITDRNSAYRERFEEAYDSCVTANTCILYFNRGN